LCAKTDILTTLAYFDVFQYPLTQTEIFFFLRHVYSGEEFVKALTQLLAEGHVFRFDEFFCLQDDYDLIIRRRKGNLAAKKLLDAADGIAKFLSSFPYVRGVAVSGSLSKNYADENSDIDFFIITKKNRLWVARTFMHLFKKFTYLLKKEHFFCMNYYVDEAALEIKEKNIYTATELATLLPLRGIGAFQHLFKSNPWSKSILPNHAMKIAYTKETRNPFFKTLVEWTLNNAAGNALDFLFMKITASRWAKKTSQKRMNANGNLMAMDAARHCAKPDPKSFQQKFMALYERSVRVVLHKYHQRLKPVP
jgi:predicted nucleotidyltransferase